MINYAWIAGAFCSFAALHTTYRIIGKRGYRQQATTAVFIGWAAVLAGTAAFFASRAGTVMPPECRLKFIVLALGMGALFPAGVACYTIAMRHGKLAPSATTMSLSITIPILGSVLIYHEKITLVRAVAIMLAVCAIILLWLDKRREEGGKTDVV